MTIVGVDEVGRGCWAGPVVAGAVALDTPIAGLADSKVLSAKRREALAAEIEISARAWGLGWVPASEVDEIGLTRAVGLAMERAVRDCMQRLDADSQQIIIDGNYNYLAHMPNTSSLIKADATVPAVSAASIMAKVERDRYMIDMARKHPGYGFEKHVGYGTAAHMAALRHLGVNELHRRSFKPIAVLLGAAA